jgi:MATE family multidrug resistance protein
MGHLLGAGDTPGAVRASYAGIGLSVRFMVLVAIIFCAYPERLISIDIHINDPVNFSLIDCAKQFLMIAAFCNILEAIRISLFGALRALKETHFTLLISIMCFWGIALPLGYLLAIHFHFEGAGLWWGMLLGAVVGVVMLYYRYKATIQNYTRY